MKGKDLFVIGGIGLALYLLMPKAKEAAAGGITTIIPMPTAAPTSPDIGGIFSGMAEMFSGILGAMPTQIVPEINIPEFKWPDISIPEINIPEFPEQFIPALPDELKIPDIPSLIPDVSGLVPGVAEGTLAERIIKGVAGRGAVDIIGELIGTRAKGIGEELIDMTAFFTGQPRPVREYLEIQALTEAQFEVAGVEEIGSMEDIKKLQRAGEITGIREALGYPDPKEVPAIGSPDYLYYMLGKPKPYQPPYKLQEVPGR